MSIEAYKCNQVGCNGFILFDNADFEYDEAAKKLDSGFLTQSCCTKCQKDFDVRLSHTLLELDEDHDYVDSVEPISYADLITNHIHSHHCSQEGCSGIISYDTTTFDYRQSLNKPTYGQLATVHCPECTREHKVVVTHALFEMNEEGEKIAVLPSCCYSEFEKARKEERQQFTTY